MKRRVCTVLIIINVILILMNIYVSEKVFYGIYRTYLFWGINLYVFTSSCIMLTNNKKFSILLLVNLALTLISFIWFIIYMPKYTPKNAISMLKSSGEFSSYHTFEIDSDDPTEPANISPFITGMYKIKAKGNPEYTVKFNPVSGKFYSKKSTDIVFKTDIFTPNSLRHNLDSEFEREYNEVSDDYESLLLLLNKYKNLWTQEMYSSFSKLILICDKYNQGLLEKDQYEWSFRAEEEAASMQSIYSQEYGDGIRLSILKAENECYQVRYRALTLKRLYIKMRQKTED